jgi:hypothetical protein
MKHGAEWLFAVAFIAMAAAWTVFAWIAGQAETILVTRSTCYVTCGSWTQYNAHWGSGQFAALMAAIMLTIGWVISLIVLAEKTDL